jgi:hypothetical protein
MTRPQQYALELASPRPDLLHLPAVEFRGRSMPIAAAAVVATAAKAQDRLVDMQHARLPVLLQIPGITHCGTHEVHPRLERPESAHDNVPTPDTYARRELLTLLRAIVHQRIEHAAGQPQHLRGL